ncbi:MAG: hypothetical protein KatS3mg102_1867 [Planctomycetota bacterium]|nr:MAG: hypothetical protein KatS3mg102_1867 [Planctomycetota bacterium]
MASGAEAERTGDGGGNSAGDRSEHASGGSAAAAGPYPPGIARLLAGEQPPAAGPPAAPRPAATVVLVREAVAGAGGIEVYLVQRARGMKFLGGAHVFPGGRVEERDGTPERAAVRELQEETGVRLVPEALLPWSRWITPEVEPRRFDALFYLAALPAGQQPRPVEGELVSGLWLAPAEAVARAERGALVLAPPTLWTLLELRGLPDVAAALARARERAAAGIETFAPRALLLPDGRLALTLAGDPAHDEPVAAPEPPPARQRRFILDGQRWIVRGGPAA